MSSESQRLNRERFGRTAEQFAASAATRDLSQVNSLVELAAVSKADRLLDVACGPGRLLAAVAPRVEFAVGVDLTLEMLVIARTQRPGEGAHPPGLVLGEGERLPFRDGAFTLVATTLAIHHFGDPRRVAGEMARVCRPGGRVAVSDLVGPADDAKRALANEIERLRDPSHVEALSGAGLEALLTSQGLVVTGRASGSLAREFKEWCRIAGTPPEVAARVRALLLETQPGDRAGMAPVMVGEEVRFRHNWMNLVAVKP
jgi:ubiquinone/menaquinone biosynthesis C-methylase UbiE